MSSYSELIKNFEKIRAYMRDFYVYGFKSRAEYNGKSSRSYDDERRRIESWLGDYMGFVRTPEGKNIFISIDSRSSEHNPLYRAFKSKSFTDGDITLHFILFDILHSPSVVLTISQIIEKIDAEYLSKFKNPFTFDESTLRKKLKEYQSEGIIECKKIANKAYYKRAEECNLLYDCELLNFFSEVAPCGVVGSYILDKDNAQISSFAFKHHYVTGTLDSSVLASLFYAMQEKRYITVINHSRKKKDGRKVEILPLKVFISVQNGRQYLLAYTPSEKNIKSYRIDYLSIQKMGEQEPNYSDYRQKLAYIQKKMWGVNSKITSYGKEHVEHVQFDVRVNDKEEYIVKRLMREKRFGVVTQIDENTYRFSAELYDSGEIIPWVRSFTGKIVRLDFSNRTVENQLKKDLKKTYEIYRLKGDEV